MRSKVSTVFGSQFQQPMEPLCVGELNLHASTSFDEQSVDNTEIIPANTGEFMSPFPRMCLEVQAADGVVDALGQIYEESFDVGCV